MKDGPEGYRNGLAFQWKAERPWINLLLLGATLLTTTMVGAGWSGVNPFTEPHLIYRGLAFSLTLIAILGAHEMGHFWVARRRGVQASWPYFIPAPIPPVGTFGAIIKIKSPLPDRRALLDIGIAGPLAGLAVTIPILIVGLRLSEVKEALPEPSSAGISLGVGTSLLFSWLTSAVVGNLTQSHHLVLHPVAFAGWFGLFVTALNLLPVGQLDGGHIVYSLFRKRHFIIARATFVSLFPLGLLWPGWFLWAFLILLFKLMHHPPPLDQITPLDGKRKVLGLVGILVFILSFPPIPFSSP